MRQINLFELTDADIDLATEARRATTPAYDSPQDLIWLHAITARRAAEKRATARAEAEAIGAAHRCSRCGIDTTRPDLCVDCIDVLALEEAS